MYIVRKSKNSKWFKSTTSNIEFKEKNNRALKQNKEYSVTPLFDNYYQLEEIPIKERINRLNEIFKSYNSSLLLNEDIFNDNEHLDILWHNGYIGAFSFQNYMVECNVINPVVLEKGKTQFVFDNDPLLLSASILNIENDEDLNLQRNTSKIRFVRRNTLECKIYAPNGKQIGTKCFNQNILEPFENFEVFRNLILTHKKSLEKCA